MDLGHLFDFGDAPLHGERFDTLLRCRELVIERIVSSDAVEPVEYVQPQDEWVLLLRGQADLDVAGVVHTLREGDHLFLPALTPHTVRRTVGGTIWLAVHLHRPQPGAAAPSPLP